MTTAANATSPAPVAFARIHVIFKTHLDIGFTDHAETVLRLYRERFIPGAIALSQELRRAGGRERFIWTTGSYIIHDYLERADATQRRAMERAITQGDIAWHALPFTSHSELMDADLFRCGLSLSKTLDARFGKTTITAKMTDVPGHTKAIFPLLAEAGVKLLHIGVNPASSFPLTPPLFRWQDPQSQTEVLVMYHTTYGDLTPGAAPGGADGLVFAHTGDNQGPPEASKLLVEFAHITDHFPSAEVQASTLDAFAHSLLPLADRLPVITSEIGDNWIHGVGSDPKKVAGLRELLRLRSQWRRQGLSAADAHRVDSFERQLLLIPEHTWGMDIKTHLSDEVTWSNAALALQRNSDKYRRVESSWQEQRTYLSMAISELGEGTLATQAMSALSSLTPRQEDTHGWMPVTAGNTIATTHFAIGFDAVSGGMLKLQHGGVQWADAQHQLGTFRYQTFSAADCRRFYAQYARDTHLHEWWIIRDITRYGMTDTDSIAAMWAPEAAVITHRRMPRADEVMIQLTMPTAAITDFGCPKQVTLLYRFPTEQSRIELTLSWFAKGATRRPEATWLGMRPRVENPEGWLMDKLGMEVSPLDVIPGGGRQLHAIGNGCSHVGARGRFAIQSLDAPLLSPGQPSLNDFHGRLPDPSVGMHWNLHNTTWCTNFPQWYDDDAQFRFVISPPSTT